MKKWYSCLDALKFPIIMLLVGNILTSLNGVVINQTTLSLLRDGAVFFGGLFRQLFPLAIIICYLGYKFDDSIIVLVAFISYSLFCTVTMFLNDGTLASYYYSNILGLSYTIEVATGTITKYPLNMGIFASIIIIVIISFTYKNSRNRYNYGMLTFINNDAWFLFSSVIFTIALGAVASWVYPYVAQRIETILNFISLNNSNPASMFVYGLMDKVLEVTGLHNIIEESFWFGKLGGSWIDSNGITYLGDVNIWTALRNNGVIVAGSGKFVTGSYVANLFIIPSIIIGYFINIENKMEKKRMFGLVVVGLITSLVSGSVIPMEMVLAFSAPMLLVIYILSYGIINMLIAILNVQIGYSLVGQAAYATVGNLKDFVKYLLNNELHSSALTLLIIGIACFVLYQVLMYVYYHYLCQHFLDSSAGKVECDNVIEALGGIDNIDMITSSSMSFVVVLKANERLNTEHMLDTKAYRVRERYFGYYIDYGPGSRAISKAIKKQISDYKECLSYSAK